MQHGAQRLAPTDERPDQPNCKCPCCRRQKPTFTSVDLIVLSPGVPIDIAPVEAARAKGIPIIGEVELAAIFFKGPICGITGSNGKTTTTALIGHILKECGIACQVGGNIGTPPTAMVATSRDDQWNVLELSSFQLETIDEFRAKIAVCTNVTPDHLDRHHTLENYADAKARLFETQTAGRTRRIECGRSDMRRVTRRGHTATSSLVQPQNALRSLGLTAARSLSSTTALLDAGRSADPRSS